MSTFVLFRNRESCQQNTSKIPAIFPPSMVICFLAEFANHALRTAKLTKFRLMVALAVEPQRYQFLQVPFWKDDKTYKCRVYPSP